MAASYVVALLCLIAYADGFAPIIRTKAPWLVRRVDEAVSLSCISRGKDTHHTQMQQPVDLWYNNEEKTGDCDELWIEQKHQRPWGQQEQEQGLVLPSTIFVLMLVAAGGAALFASPSAAVAAAVNDASSATTTTTAAAAAVNIFDPTQFQPVCPGSDGVYQVLKVTANSLVGSENVVEYGPLIASVLLRVRLELCVLESFLYEAVVPFVQKKGLSWVLPLHETVETFLAGTIFAVASNFILLGSTKILSVLFIYADALTGFPARLLGGAVKKASPKASPGEIIGSGIKTYGDVLGGVRGLLEATDTFVGRYLVIATTAYIAFKFCHYKFFNEII